MGGIIIRTCRKRKWKGKEEIFFVCTFFSLRWLETLFSRFLIQAEFLAFYWFSWLIDLPPFYQMFQVIGAWRSSFCIVCSLLWQLNLMKNYMAGKISHHLSLHVVWPAKMLLYCQILSHRRKTFAYITGSCFVKKISQNKLRFNIFLIEFSFFVTATLNFPPWREKFPWNFRSCIFLYAFFKVCFVKCHYDSCKNPH